MYGQRQDVVQPDCKCRTEIRCNALLSEAWQCGSAGLFTTFANQRLLPLDANRFCQVVPQIGTMLLTNPAARNTRIYSGPRLIQSNPRQRLRSSNCCHQ